MLFNSVDFAVFFVLVLGLYWLLPLRGQNRLLLAASYFFYGYWDWRFLSLILISSLVDYLAGQRVQRAAERGERGQAARKTWLSLSIVVNLGLLGVFKYYNFFIGSVGPLASLLGLNPAALHLELVLPVGISFYTFQTMSYTIDIYRGRLKPTGSFWDFALFVAFFPQLVAGPIERASRLLPQLIAHRHFSKPQFLDGLRLIFWGLFMKVYVADNLAPFVDQVFAAKDPGGPAVLFAVYAFAFQIYCDFAGYSKIARGVAKCLGVEIMVNFNHPYISASIREFWRRWHISLSTWFRDYLYIPLGGNRRGRARTYVNLALTMLICGLWHGAAWTFVLWGGYHGVLLLGQRIWAPQDKPEPRRWLRALKVLITFHLACLGWLIFRSQSLGQLGEMAVRLFGFSGAWSPALAAPLMKFALPLVAAEALAGAVGSGRLRPPRAVLIAGYAVLFYLLAFYGAQAQSFIYFQF